MPYLLNCCYLVFLAVASPILLWRVMVRRKYRHGGWERLVGRVPSPPKTSPSPRIWFQAVSVGEVNLLRPILAELNALHPDWDVVISTTSQTGFDLARTLFPTRVVFRCPLDFSWSVRRAMRSLRPDLLVLVELELWPNLILAAKEAGAKVAIVNGRISDASFPAYRRIRWFLSRWFRSVDFVAASDDFAAERFCRLGMPSEKIVVTGSIKFDGTATDRNNRKTLELAAAANIPPDATVFLAGSTQEPEEGLAVETFLALSPAHKNLWLILVPRHPERFEVVAAMLEEMGVPWTRRSTWNVSPPTTNERPPRILLVDSVGELGAWWGCTQIAFVGGSLGTRGGQNMLEPAGYGAAVSFGPNTRNFREISSAMLRADAAVVVADGIELTAFVAWSLDKPDDAHAMGLRAQELVLRQRGATKRTVAELVRELIVD